MITESRPQKVHAEVIEKISNFVDQLRFEQEQVEDVQVDQAEEELEFQPGKQQ